jgi:hypothetical protein
VPFDFTAAGTSATTAEFAPGVDAVVEDEDVDALVFVGEDDELLLPHPATTAATPTSDSHNFHVRM